MFSEMIQSDDNLYPMAIRIFQVIETEYAKSCGYASDHIVVTVILDTWDLSLETRVEVEREITKEQCDEFQQFLTDNGWKEVEHPLSFRGKVLSNIGYISPDHVQRFDLMMARKYPSAPGGVGEAAW